MDQLPQRQSLDVQTARLLRSQIMRGELGVRLPAERTLCAQLQIGRNTLRLALAQLEREGLIERRQGSGTRVRQQAVTHALRAAAGAQQAAAGLQQTATGMRHAVTGISQEQASGMQRKGASGVAKTKRAAGVAEKKEAAAKAMQSADSNLRTLRIGRRTDALNCTEEERGVGSRTTRRAAVNTVWLLLPANPDGLRPLKLGWLDAFRLLLRERGLGLRVEVARARNAGHVGQSLARLLADATDAACWVLALSEAATQRWFQQQQVPCVLAGSAHAGVDLPSLDCDFRALGRHAAGRMLGGGHRQIAYLVRKSRYAGDAECQRGFEEAVRAHHPQTAVNARIVAHDGRPEAMAAAVRKLLGGKSRTTACFVDNGYDYLTLASLLQRRGVRIPEDMSLICRSDEHFLQYLLPVPDRYVTAPAPFARRLCALVVRGCESRFIPAKSATHFHARFVEGKSFRHLAR